MYRSVFHQQSILLSFSILNLDVISAQRIHLVQVFEFHGFDSELDTRTATVIDSYSEHCRCSLSSQRARRLNWPITYHLTIREQARFWQLTIPLIIATRTFPSDDNGPFISELFIQGAIRSRLTAAESNRSLSTVADWQYCGNVTQDEWETCQQPSYGSVIELKRYDGQYRARYISSCD